MHHEAQRQQALDAYRIVDSLPEAAYEDIVRIAAAVCDVPTALITLVDRDRQWFKARLQFDARETPRDEAFCDHAIRTPDRLLEVSDATLDPRFANYPNVGADGGVRFYAGMPLVTPGGAAIGTVCVVDDQPRTLDDGQRDALAALARLTINLFEGRLRDLMVQRAQALAPPVAGPTHEPCTVAVYEVQGAAAAADRLGERALERELQSLSDALDAIAPTGCSVNRVSGSAETIAVLHGADNARTLERMAEAVEQFQARTGLRVLVGTAHEGHANERPEDIFARADAALFQQKARPSAT